jgi:cytochrome P450
MSWFNGIYNCFNSRVHSTPGHHFKLQEAPPLNRCAQISGWLKWTVSYPLVTAHKLFNGCLLAKHQELSKPFEKNVSYKRPVNQFPFFNMNLKIVTQGMDVFLKPFRHNPESGFFKDRATSEVFMKLLKSMYPDAEVTEKDFLFTCHERHVPMYRNPILDFIGPKNMPNIRKELEEITQTLLAQIGSFGIDADDFAGVFTSTVISRIMLRHPGPIETYRKIYKAVGAVNKFSMQERWVKLSPQQQEEYANARAVLIQAIEISQKNEERGSFVEALRSSEMTDIQIKSTLFLLYSAGIETTDAAIKYILWQLGQHPEYQQRIVDDERGGDELIAKLIDECLRMAPPVGIIGRFATKDLEFSLQDKQQKKVYSTRIRQDEGVLLAPGLAARDPQVYENPSKFNPDRFKVPLSYLPWLPFGGGGHGCPGQWLARAQLTILVSELVRKFRITSMPDKPELTPTLFMSLKHKESVTLAFSKR